ncbi:NUDIX domain-containing protein [Streptomyces polychromogenes]|nr:NUDIX domain-containing protein [Streptomyces polychromogenes]
MARRRPPRTPQPTHQLTPRFSRRPSSTPTGLDSAHRLLLLRRRDPFDGTWLWEPPGGGIEPGEAPLTAVRRELAEETVLNPTATPDRSVLVDRDVQRIGKRHVGAEQFFVARFADAQPPLVQTGLLPDEQTNLDAHAWIAWPDLKSRPNRLEPPQLLAVLAALVPDGPWCDRGRAGDAVTGVSAYSRE